ncbi:hypothetical protein OXPF_11900 [Oxobacter pfennigii]|uniref:Uncharacterized protein n=1 Tax=Oxobacter pfennigii TaxID=36849 RepID=A0A0P8WBJ4_9CLOT|nr:hypothetical protein [Oxobacter pfennigii]KPU45297.1 hypothetical protein OXPF_11900 [Oxobacter pfennigii]
MRKKFYFFMLIALMSIILSSCSIISKKPLISEPVVAKLIDSQTSKPIEASKVFLQSDAAVYFTVKTTDLPKDTVIKVTWKHLDGGTEIPSQLTANGSGYEVFTLKKSGELFPSGQYEVTAIADINGSLMELKEQFQIVAEVKATHLLNPVTAKAVDSNDKLNPLDVTSRFSQSDPVVYFVIQSKDLPADTKVSCQWVYTTTGDSLSHELITDGSRNIAFSLKPENAQKLPAGKYIVKASIITDAGTEMVSKEFEIVE